MGQARRFHAHKKTLRGEALSAGAVSLGETVVMDKCSVSSFSTDSSGYAETRSGVTGNLVAGTLTTQHNGGSWNLSGGGTDLKVEEYGAYLSSTTQITTTGPCRWEVEIWR